MILATTTLERGINRILSRKEENLLKKKRFANDNIVSTFVVGANNDF
jgi:hypothetical protein